MLRSLLTCALAAHAAFAAPHARSIFAVKDTHNAPAAWLRTGRAGPDQLIRFNIGLIQGRFDELERNLYEVSDPSHHRYGKHLSAEDVNELIKPKNEAIEAVHKWLEDAGVRLEGLEYSPAKDWIKLTLPTEEVERLLNTEYHYYEHEDGMGLVRAETWSLPTHLHEHIATVQPTNSFSRMRPVAKRHAKAINMQEPPPPPTEATIAAVCNTTLVTPLCLRTLYGTVNYTVQPAGKNKMALNDFLGQLNNRSDASIYLEMFRPEATAAAYQFEQISVAGGSLQQTPENASQLSAGIGVEGALDVQTMLGIAWPIPLTAYSTGATNPEFVPDLFTPTDNDEPYIAWLQYILAQTDLPSVISTSYGDDEQTVSYAYATHACSLFAQLGARGVSVFFGSGDYGVGLDGGCVSNDGKNTTMFLPQFPSSCQYVTSVGGTRHFEPEVAALEFSSGGGFSNYFPRPAYQDQAVSTYLSKYIGSEYAGLYNKSGRGIPDIVAQGESYTTVLNGTIVPIDGTSAATPTAASIFALVNDALIAAGKPPMGFLNPWLYAGGYKAFNDILSGNSTGCNTDGFPAKPGWDAVTGYGTPYFPDILALLRVGDGSGWKDWEQ
jgi:tripeptidyl-peptidase-1